MKHDFIKTGDPDSHQYIRDRNGEVVLQECRRCKQAEGSLAEECPFDDPSVFIVDRLFLRKLVDYVWKTSRESTTVPSTSWADRMIEEVLKNNSHVTLGPAKEGIEKITTALDILDKLPVEEMCPRCKTPIKIVVKE